MISISKLKKIITSKKKNFTTDDFLTIHRFTEGYLKRITFIGLRLNDIQYNTAKELTDFIYIGGIHSQIKKIFELLPQNHSYETIIRKHKDFEIIYQLFKNYSCPLRNRLVHGGIGKIKNQDVLFYACSIDKKFIESFENILKKEWGHSAFDTPGKWGAKRITMIQKNEDIIQKLKLGKFHPSELNLEKVKNILSKHQIKL